MPQTPIEFTDTVPGTILHDFQALMDMVGTDGLRISGAHGMFPIDRLVELDAKLAAPLKLAMKRPLLYSYPNVAGLCMLFRSSGMGLIEGNGSTQRLVINARMLDRWQQLSSVDRYWNLLGVWWALVRTSGPDGRGEALQDLTYAMDQASGDRASGELLATWASAMSLLGMFGIVRIDALARSPRHAYWVAKAAYTPMGVQMAALFSDLLSGDFPLLRLRDDIAKEPGQRLREFQQLIRPAATQWKELLLPPSFHQTFAGTLTIKVSLDSVWRRFEAPSTTTLSALVDQILVAFKFDDDHLYELCVASATGDMIPYGHAAMDDTVSASGTTLGDIPFRVRQKHTLHYDFGDDWRFDILIEAMEPRSTNKVRLIASEGKPPKQYRSW